MLLGALFLVALLGVQSTPIKDGEIVTDIRAHPYVVRLFIIGRVWKEGKKVIDRSMCSGILVKEDFVVTAAHCIEDEVDPPLIIVKAGTTDLLKQETLQTGTGKTYKKHSNYNKNPTYGNRKPYGENDIALVWLDEKLEMRQGMRLANLESTLTDLTNAIGVAVGWGSTKKEISPTTLQRVKMIVMPKDTCEGITINRLYNQFCASGKSHPDSGDSGGPFVVNKMVVGVNSWLNLDGRLFAVFVRIYPYIDWIEKNYKKGPPKLATNNPTKPVEPTKSNGQKQSTTSRKPNGSRKPGNQSNETKIPKKIVNPSKTQTQLGSNGPKKPLNNTNKKQQNQEKNRKTNN